MPLASEQSDENPKAGSPGSPAKKEGEDEDQDELFIKHPYFDNPSRIKAIHCGRWSTILEMHDP